MSLHAVTGCAGFIGSHLSEALVEAGHEVVGIDAFTDYYARDAKNANVADLRSHSAFSLVEADLAEARLDSVLEGVDAVYHLAAQPGVRGSWGASFPIYVHDNVVATQRVLEYAAAAGVRVVLASSSSVYGDAEGFPTREDARPLPISPYGVTKLSCEYLATAYERNYELEWIGMRYFTVYGPRQRPDMAFQRILAALVNGTTFTLNGTGEQSRDFTYVADAVSATVDAMEHGVSGSVYNVGGGTETSLRSVIETCEDLSGRQLEITRTVGAAGDVRRTAADTTRIRRDVGWEPRTTLVDGLACQLDALVNQATARCASDRATASATSTGRRPS